MSVCVWFVWYVFSVCMGVYVCLCNLCLFVCGLFGMCLVCIWVCMYVCVTYVCMCVVCLVCV